MLAHGRFVNNVLVDGMLRATWWLEREEGALDARIRPFGDARPLPSATRSRPRRAR